MSVYNLKLMSIFIWDKKLFEVVVPGNHLNFRARFIGELVSGIPVFSYPDLPEVSFGPTMVKIWPDNDLGLK